MAHVLKPGALAEKRRAHYRAKRPSFLTETSISFEAAQHRLIDLGNGQRKTIMAMSDNEFREWYYSLIEQLVTRLKPSEKKVQSLINVARKESCDLRLDEEARWYLADKLYGTKAFRESGIEIFVRQEDVA